MRVIVSGGTGLIGSELVASLSGDGHEVVVLSRGSNKDQFEWQDNVSIERWDAKTVGDWGGLLDGADAVVNLAGESLSGEGFLPDWWTQQKKRRIRDSRVDAGRALVEAIKIVENKPSVLVQASAVGYYGSRGAELVSESSSPGDDYLASVCVDWEAATAPVEALGVRHVIARTGLVLSTNGGALPRLILPSKLYGGGYFGSGKQWWPWIHMADVVSAIRFLIENESASDPVNLTAPNPVTNRAFGRALGRAMGKPSLLPVPGFVMRKLLGEVSVTVLEGQHAVPHKLQQLGYTFQFPNVNEALLDLVNSQAAHANREDASVPNYQVSS